jgi:hypothetical protein
VFGPIVCPAVQDESAQCGARLASAIEELVSRAPFRLPGKAEAVTASSARGQDDEDRAVRDRAADNASAFVGCREGSQPDLPLHHEGRGVLKGRSHHSRRSTLVNLIGCPTGAAPVGAVGRACKAEKKVDGAAGERRRVGQTVPLNDRWTPDTEHRPSGRSSKYRRPGSTAVLGFLLASSHTSPSGGPAASVAEASGVRAKIRRRDMGNERNGSGLRKKPRHC